MPPPTTGRAARLALAVLLCALAVPPAAAAAPRAPSPAKDASWTARPAGSGSGGKGGRPYFYLEGAPGSVLQDRLSVTNPGRSPITVRLRGTDGPGAGTAPRPGTEGAPGTGPGAWLRAAATEVTVPARTRADVPFTVTVPAGAVPGDRSGAIVVRGGARSVEVDLRLRIGGPAVSALTVEDVTVSGRTIRYTLVNRGNTVLAPEVAVRADGLFGTLLRREARALPVRLLPGQRLGLTEPWWDTPALDSTTVRLRVTAAGDAHGEATAHAVFVPWAPLTGGAVFLLAAVATGAYAYRRRRPRGRPVDDGRPAGEDRPVDGGRLPGGDRSERDQQHSGTRHSVQAGAES
ncbi:COG1470 family protein [Streptomyces sp. NPDC002559]